MGCLTRRRDDRFLYQQGWLPSTKPMGQQVFTVESIPTPKFVKELMINHPTIYWHKDRCTSIECCFSDGSGGWDPQPSWFWLLRYSGGNANHSTITFWLRLFVCRSRHNPPSENPLFYSGQNLIKVLRSTKELLDSPLTKDSRRFGRSFLKLGFLAQIHSWFEARSMEHLRILYVWPTYSNFQILPIFPGVHIQVACCARGAKFWCLVASSWDFRF